MVVDPCSGRSCFAHSGQHYDVQRSASTPCVSASRASSASRFSMSAAIAHSVRLFTLVIAQLAGGHPAADGLRFIALPAPSALTLGRRHYDLHRGQTRG